MISVFTYFKLKDVYGDDNQVYPAETVENTNTNTVSPNINVKVDTGCTSPTQGSERSNSFYLVNRVLNNHIYTSSTDNGRLYNNSLYSYIHIHEILLTIHHQIHQIHLMLRIHQIHN